MTPGEEEVDQLKKQNAMLMRALMRVRAERDALLKQIAAIETAAPARSNAEEAR